MFVYKVSRAIAIKVAQVAEEEGLATVPPPEDETWASHITDLMWTPEYQPLVRE
jgi:malic enzyme